MLSVYQQVLEEYPDSTEANLAKQRLELVTRGNNCWRNRQSDKKLKLSVASQRYLSKLCRRCQGEKAVFSTCIAALKVGC